MQTVNKLFGREESATTELSLISRCQQSASKVSLFPFLYWGHFISWTQSSSAWKEDERLIMTLKVLLNYNFHLNKLCSSPQCMTGKNNLRNLNNKCHWAPHIRCLINWYYTYKIYHNYSPILHAPQHKSVYHVRQRTPFSLWFSMRSESKNTHGCWPTAEQPVVNETCIKKNENPDLHNTHTSTYLPL